jgi:RHS repeat-associated protein
VGSGSSNITRSDQASYLPSGQRTGNWPILELIDCGGNLTWHYRCEDQLGTLRGMTDAAGIRVAEVDTSTLEPKQCFGSSTFASRTGEVYHKHSLWRGSASPNPRSRRELFDGRASHIDSANWEPLSQVTHILLVPGVFFPEEVLGAVLRATNSESAATAVVTVQAATGIEFDDPNGAVADIVSNDDGQFLIFDNRMAGYTGYPTTGGTWTGVETETLPDLSMRTILHCGGEDFREFTVGWQVQIDAAVPVYLDIVEVDGELLYVAGDVSALVTANETEFCIIHPVGVNPQNGATQTNPCQPESRYLWGGGYYLPPVAGFEMDHEGNYGIHGQQPGKNKSGQHYMWNRIYDIAMGRWTSPDPAVSPWENLFEYSRGNPNRSNDPSGLSGGFGHKGPNGEWVIDIPAWDAFGPQPGSEAMIEFWRGLMFEYAKKGNLEAWGFARERMAAEQQEKLRRARVKMERRQRESDARLDELIKRATTPPPATDTPEKDTDTPYRGFVARMTGVPVFLPSNASQCDDYPDGYTYMGANAKCFCKCAGDTPWAMRVRSCLYVLWAVEGWNAHDAHVACYLQADAMFPYQRPDCTLAYCFAKCAIVKSHKDFYEDCKDDGYYPGVAPYPSGPME